MPEYMEWADVFITEKSDQLILHSDHDLHINIYPETKPPFGPLYPCSHSELKVLKEYLNKAMATGKINRSNSPATALIHFIPKSNGKVHILVDYRGLNKVTIKDKYPLPLMSELRDRLGAAADFTKIDRKDEINLLRIAKGDKWKQLSGPGMAYINIMLCHSVSAMPPSRSRQ